MTNREKITDGVYAAMDEMNELLPPERQLAKSPDTILYGRGGRLDSLELVNLIIATEQAIEDAFGTVVVLADERAMSQQNSPFRTVATFVGYIALLLEGQAAAAGLQP